MFRRISDWLALTGTERKVILFLAGALVVGAGIRLFQETFPSVPGYDYAASDSVFAVLSGKSSEDTIAEDDTAATVIVNINTATKQELMSLPGVGAVMAERILAYRTNVSPFASARDLQNVKGIGKRKLEKLLPLVRTK